MEYLPTLQERQKWYMHKRNVKVDDLVLVVDERYPRGQWPIGRIMEVHPDSAGHVRSAKIRTADSTKIRPIAKLCFLEADMGNEEQNVEIDSEDKEDISMEVSQDTNLLQRRPVRNAGSALRSLLNDSFVNHFWSNMNMHSLYYYVVLS